MCTTTHDSDSGPHGHFMAVPKCYTSSIGGNTEYNSKSHDHNCARKWALDFSPTGTVPLTLAQQWLCQMGIFYWYSREPLLWHMYSIVLGVTDSLWVFQFSQIKNSKRVCTHGVCVCVCVCVCIYLSFSTEKS